MSNNDVAAFDLDGTLLKKNGSFAFCQFLCRKGLVSRSDFLYCAFTYLRHRYFSLSLWDLHSLIFKRLFLGAQFSRLPPLVDEFLDHKLHALWYAPAMERLRQLQNRGVECWVLSNSPSFLVVPIAQKAGITKVFATEYGCNEKGELVLIKALMDGAKKGEVIAAMGNTTAFSDSHLDFEFLDAANRAVAVNPNSKLKKIAINRGWEIL